MIYNVDNVEADADAIKLEQLAQDIALLHIFVHGTENDSVVLGGVVTPCLRSFVKAVKANAEYLLAQANEFEERVAQVEEQTSVAQETFVDSETGETYGASVLTGLYVEDAQ